MRKLLSGTPNQMSLSDDILIVGSEEDHDASLQKVLSKLNVGGITLNTGKCVFNVEEISLYLIGAPKFKIVTDHKPLIYMFHRTSGDLPPRVREIRHGYTRF